MLHIALNVQRLWLVSSPINDECIACFVHLTCDCCMWHFAVLFILSYSWPFPVAYHPMKWNFQKRNVDVFVFVWISLWTSVMSWIYLATAILTTKLPDKRQRPKVVAPFGAGSPDLAEVVTARRRRTLTTSCGCKKRDLHDFSYSRAFELVLKRKPEVPFYSLFALKYSLQVAFQSKEYRRVLEVYPR